MKKAIYISLSIIVILTLIGAVFYFYPEKEAEEPKQEPIDIKDYNGEVKDGLVLIRKLDKKLIEQKINDGKEFLLRMEHSELHGFYKRYEALEDEFDKRLHTVYSASIIYTFLYINDYREDKKILEKLSDWADFLLFMQNKDKNSQTYGAFHYSYYFDKKEKEQRFVTGTSALSIFTLLRLYEITKEEKYLEAAKLAGDWLISMQKQNGVMKAHLTFKKDKWTYGEKESLLYNGQVLSSLSKLYKATGNEKYYNSAKKIANHFASKYEAAQGYLAGEYRKKNPISNAWIVMSLMDFYKVDGSERYKNIVFELSSMILDNQIRDANDILNHGRFEGAYSTSGIGWISEVMTDTYKFCLEERGEENRDDCEKYKNAVIMAIRWIIQNTYSEENVSLLKNPERAIGGVFWDKFNKYVRTDSVCHALNSYVRIIEHLEDGLLLNIPKGSQE